MKSRQTKPPKAPPASPNQVASVGRIVRAVIPTVSGSPIIRPAIMIDCWDDPEAGEGVIWAELQPFLSQHDNVSCKLATPVYSYSKSGDLETWHWPGDIDRPPTH